MSNSFNLEMPVSSWQSQAYLEVFAKREKSNLQIVFTCNETVMTSKCDS